jgi:Zn-dependent peptidase ImmA (M78 family)
MHPRKIDALVSRVLEENKIDRPPVPVEALARKLGAQLRYSPFEGDISGMVFRQDDQTIIGINSLHHPNRQRFTIAHEIGHMLLHKGVEIHVDRTFRVNLRNDISSQAVDRDEIEANRFAAELLMPEQMLIGHLKGHEIDFEKEDDLRRLAAKYQVSPQALTFRLMNLGLISAA